MLRHMELVAGVLYYTLINTTWAVLWRWHVASVKVKMIDILTSALCESLILGPNELGSSFYGPWCF